MRAHHLRDVLVSRRRLVDEVLPLAMRMLRGESLPVRVTTRHVLVTATNVFIEYPPYDMN